MIYRYTFTVLSGDGSRETRSLILTAQNHKKAWKQGKASLGLYTVLGFKIEHDTLERGILKKVVTEVFEPIQEIQPTR